MTTALIGGAIANRRRNGMVALRPLTYALGLRRLGLDVYVVEETEPKDCDNAAGSGAPFTPFGQHRGGCGGGWAGSDDPIPISCLQVSCHPGVGADALSTPRTERSRELVVLCDPAVRHGLGAEGSVLCAFNHFMLDLTRGAPHA
jgi:hypothetical protein